MISFHDLLGLRPNPNEGQEHNIDTKTNKNRYQIPQHRVEDGPIPVTDK